MTPTVERRPPAAHDRIWPIEPFVAYIAADMGIPVHQPTSCPGCHGSHQRSDDRPICLTKIALARRLHVDPNQIHRWYQVGLTDTQADHLAVAAGTLPSRIWTDWDRAGLTVNDEIFLYGLPGAEPGWRPAAGYPSDSPATKHASAA